MLLLRTLLVVVTLTGVTHADQPVEEMRPADVTKWLTFFDKLVSTVVGSNSTCEKMASDVSSVIDANKDAVALARQAKAQGKKLPPAAQQRMIDGVKKMVPGMQKCGQNERVRAAFAKLDLNRKG